jgi:hypothetical protein
LSADLPVAQSKVGVFKYLRGVWIGGEVDLEAAIKPESFDLVGTHPAPDALGGFEQEKREALAVELARTGESGEAAANDDDRIGHPFSTEEIDDSSAEPFAILVPSEV